MPVFFQQDLNEDTRLAVWKISEPEAFFKDRVPSHRDVTHPHKRLQHLAGRYLLQYMFPDFPYELILLADTRKPYLPDEQYHFSISHCGDYAAAIVSRSRRVGIDVEIPVEKISRIMYKFLSADEHERFGIMNFSDHRSSVATVYWSAKEAVYKWFGDGAVDFRRNIRLTSRDEQAGIIDCQFTKTNQDLKIHYREFDQLVLAWVLS